MKTQQTINDLLVRNTFAKNKVLTINELKLIVPLSVRTIHSRLKLWNAVNSYNKNGMYYTLPNIAQFDSNGLWSFQNIHFSQYGNLKQTIVELVNRSTSGLNAQQLGELLKMNTHSFISHFVDLKGIIRDKMDGSYVWYSSDLNTCQKQKLYRTETSKKQNFSSIKDSIAVLILVEKIKNPDMDVFELAELLSKQGIRIKPITISVFLNFYGIEKKNKVTDV